MKSKFFVPLTIATACLAFTGRAQAVAYTETGDAGELPATAQIVSMPTAGVVLTSISGTLTVTNNVSENDLFEIYIPDPANFSAADPFGIGKNNFDSQIFVFDANGLGLIANDDSPSGGEQSSIPAATFSGPAGLYYILISGGGQIPGSAAGKIFPSQTDGTTDPTGVYGPTGPGGGSPLSKYLGNSSAGGNYTITLTGAQFVVAAVPEPGTYALILVGAAGLGLAVRARRRREQAA